MVSAGRSRKVLIIVENLPVPFDRRVWQEAKTLKDAGYEVSVICPVGKGLEARYELLEGIHIYRHQLSIRLLGGDRELYAGLRAEDSGDKPPGYRRYLESGHSLLVRKSQLRPHRPLCWQALG